MTEFIKSTVKCYKKKTKKMVGGHRKTYEYNQYQVPLKKSDNLGCSEEVFVIPQSQFEELIMRVKGSQQEESEAKKSIIAEYDKMLKDLEWKHGELSRSYKALVSKNAKTNKRLRLTEEKTVLFETLNTGLKDENQKLQNQLREINKQFNDLKEKSGSHTKKTISKEYDPNLKKDKDLLTSIRSRFSRKEDKDQEDQD